MDSRSVTEKALEPFILALDAAGSSCSVAIAAGETVLCAERLASAHRQAEALLPMVDTAMRKAALPPSTLDLIATTVGPGSFTGIRVGLAAARGIALATGAGLIGVSSFEAVAASFAPPVRYRSARFLLVALESRREDLYIQLFDLLRHPLGVPAAVMPTALREVVGGTVGAALLLVAGDAAQHAAVALSRRPRTILVENSAPDAIGVVRAALHRWRLGGPGKNPRPLYLHPPNVTPSNGHQRAGGT